MNPHLKKLCGYVFRPRAVIRAAKGHVDGENETIVSEGSRQLDVRILIITVEIYCAKGRNLQMTIISS